MSECQTLTSRNNLVDCAILPRRVQYINQSYKCLAMSSKITTDWKMRVVTIYEVQRETNETFVSIPGLQRQPNKDNQVQKK